MKRAIRSILAVVLGAFTAFLLIGVIEMVGMFVFPPPVKLDFTKPESIKAAMTQLPVGAFAMVLVAYGIGPFVGAWVSARVAGWTPMVHGMIIGVLTLAAGIQNMLEIPHPVWFWVIAVPLFPTAAYPGAKMAGGRADKRALKPAEA